MLFIYQDVKNGGTLDGIVISKTEKPSFSFEYEYLYFSEELAEYAPKDKANYPDHSPSKEEVKELYENRALSDIEYDEVLSFCKNYKREPSTKPEHNPAKEKLQWSGDVETVDGFTFKKYEVVDKTSFEKEEYLNEKRLLMLAELSSYFSKISQRPVINAGYGFSVQAGYSDLLDFQVGLDLALLTIRAADNSNHTVTQEQFEDIIGKIKQNGVRLKSVKWTIQDEIERASIEELEQINFEERFND